MISVRFRGTLAIEYIRRQSCSRSVGDGSYGHQHTRQCCADVLEDVASELKEESFDNHDLYVESIMEAGGFAMYLREEMSDDAAEDGACEWLDDHAPTEGAFWGWRDGDFGLWPRDDIER